MTRRTTRSPAPLRPPRRGAPPTDSRLRCSPSTWDQPPSNLSPRVACIGARRRVCFAAVLVVAVAVGIALVTPPDGADPLRACGRRGGYRAHVLAAAAVHRIIELVDFATVRGIAVAVLEAPDAGGELAGALRAAARQPV